MAKIIINESDHEKTIKANVGDEIEIILANNEAVKRYWGIGGGESWSTGASAVLIFNNNKGAQITIKEGRAGGFGGTSMFPFTVASTGMDIVELLLKASGEPVEAAQDHFRVIIIAEPLKPAVKNTVKHKYCFMRWEGKPGTKYEEILVDGKSFTIETDNPLIAYTTLNRYIHHLPGFKIAYQIPKQGPGEDPHTIGSRVVFEDGREEYFNAFDEWGYDQIKHINTTLYK